MKLAAFVVFAVCVASLDALKLPSYIKACSRKDPNLNKCAEKNARLAIPELLKGDPKYKIPKLNPLTLPEIFIQASDNLKVTLTDAVITGLQDIDIREIAIDIPKETFDIKAVIPRANLKAKYEVDGKILILPIQGKGPANITFVDGHYNFSMKFSTTERNGKEYLQIADSKLNYATQRSFYQLDNLFNGDARLGSEMNKFLDENWREVSKDIGPALSDTISTIITSIVENIFQKVPFNEVFTE